MATIGKKCFFKNHTTRKKKKIAKLLTLKNTNDFPREKKKKKD
jgi:hypothetical protein